MVMAKLQDYDIQIFSKVSWSHHIILMQKIKDLPENLKGSLPSVEEIENKLNELGL